MLDRLFLYSLSLSKFFVLLLGFLFAKFHWRSFEIFFLMLFDFVLIVTSADPSVFADKFFRPSTACQEYDVKEQIGKG
jgi:hypothetical protein